MDISRQQSFSNPTSYPPNGPATTSTVDQGINAGPSAGPRASVPREIHESPDPRYPDLEDDFTYVNNDEELDLGEDHEGGVMASTSPSASARINRVSHNPNRYFDSPEHQNSQRSTEGKSGANGKTNAAHRFFNEKQVNAAKVSPISYADTQSAEIRRDMPLDANSKKRQNPFDNLNDDSDDESDGFEQHNRDAGRRPEKRQRFQDSASDESAAGRQLRSNLNNSKQTGQGPPNSTQTPRVRNRDDSEDITDGETTLSAPPSTSQSQPTYAPGSHWAKINARAISSHWKTRKPHSRWTDAEDERLLQLMEQFGTSYATIKREDCAFPASEGGPLLENRNQVQCKDRARNLKKKYQR